MAEDYPQKKLFRLYDEYTMLTLLAKLEELMLDSEYGEASEGEDNEGRPQRRTEERQGREEEPRTDPQLRREAEPATAGADGQGDVPQLACPRQRREEPTGYL